MARRILIYVSGPYRSAGPEEIPANMKRAQAIGRVIKGMGAMPVIPHNMTVGIEDCADNDEWLECLVEVQKRCDAVYMMPNWKSASGCIREYQEAQDTQQPIFDSLNELFVFVQEMRRKLSGEEYGSEDDIEFDLTVPPEEFDTIFKDKEKL